MYVEIKDDLQKEVLSIGLVGGILRIATSGVCEFTQETEVFERLINLLDTAIRVQKQKEK
jgi:hypothetical protein